ncbi:hypothetical protein HU200_049150 [Digitaria exilis]|uniref:Protein kinase domain-containing protein n=1 Tax=Digitaria exilis TaxID=1010633 RepID=A0A835AR10_9POAL|nr:hypothetical protein HU200_049150 [Digitaria exilis]
MSNITSISYCGYCGTAARTRTDSVIIVEKITEIASMITKTVETVKKNKEECRGIEKLVRRVCDLLSLLKESEIMRHGAVSGPLKDLRDAISRAHEVVTACQGRNIMCRFRRDRKLAKKLNLVKGDITQGIMCVIFATQVASVFVVTNGQHSVQNLSVFFVQTYRPPPPSRQLPYPSPLPVVEDHQPSLLTHKPPSHRPLDANVGTDPLPYLSAQEDASYSPIDADVPNLHPHSHGHVSPPPPPPPLPPLPRTNIAPLVSKHIPRRPPKQQPPPSPPPSPPASLHAPAYATSSKSEQPHPSSNVPPDSPPQSSVEVVAVEILINILVLSYNKVFKYLLNCSSESDERKNKPAETEESPPPLPGLKRFSFSELKAATKNFSNQNKIGASKYGTVYKVLLIRSIILRLAQGLYYIHEQNIVHMNVKPANVLLDSDLNPKITDFGIARILKRPIIHDNNIAGTVGYMPPKYILEGTLSIKYDVYSFGVTLLEAISVMYITDQNMALATPFQAWNVREYHQMVNTFDPSLFDESEVPEIRRCLEIGLLCTQFEQAERPTMPDILDMLNGRKALTTPKQPEYTKNKSL